MAIQFNPAQERDNVDIQNPSTKKSNLASSFQPISNEPIKKAQSWLSEKEKLQRKAINDAQNQLIAKAKNDIDNVAKNESLSVVNTQGENSVTAAQKAQIKLREQIDIVVSKVPKALQGQVKIAADSSIRSFNQTAQGHQYKELKALRDDTYKERNSILTEQAVLSSGNLDQFNNYLGQIDSNVNEYIRSVKGGAEDEPSETVKLDIMSNQLKAKSATILKTVEAYVSQADMTSANFFASQYKDMVTASDMIRINKLLKDGKENEDDSRAKAYFDRAVRESNNDEMVGLDLLRAWTGEDTKTYSKAANLYRQYSAAYRTQEQIRRDKQKADAFQAIKKGQQVDDTKIDVRDRPAIHEYRQKAADGRLNIRDPKTFNMLIQRSLISPDEFRDPERTNIAAYEHKLTPSDLNGFLSLQRSMVDPVSSRFTMKPVEPLVNSYIQRVAGTKGYSMKDDPVQFAKIQSQVWAEALDVKASVIASLPERASVNEYETRFFAEMAKRYRKQVTENKFGIFDRVFGNTTSGRGYFEELTNPTKETRVEEDKDYQKGFATSSSALLNEGDPDVRKAYNYWVKKNPGKEIDVPTINKMAKDLKTQRSLKKAIDNSRK